MTGVIALLLAATSLFPSSALRSVFHVEDPAGRAVGDLMVRSLAGRVRMDMGGHTFFYDGERWKPDIAQAYRTCPAAVAVMAALSPDGDVRTDDGGRPTLATRMPVAGITARVDWRYDASGLAASNLVYSDGAGFSLRRTSAEAGGFTLADLEPPRDVAPAAVPGSPSGAGGSDADEAAVARLMAMRVSGRRLAAFARDGGLHFPGGSAR